MKSHDPEACEEQSEWLIFPYKATFIQENKLFRRKEADITPILCVSICISLKCNLVDLTFIIKIVRHRQTRQCLALVGPKDLMCNVTPVWAVFISKTIFKVSGTINNNILTNVMLILRCRQKHLSCMLTFLRVIPLSLSNNEVKIEQMKLQGWSVSKSRLKSSLVLYSGLVSVASKTVSSSPGAKLILPYERDSRLLRCGSFCF